MVATNPEDLPSTSGMGFAPLSPQVHITALSDTNSPTYAAMGHAGIPSPDFTAAAAAAAAAAAGAGIGHSGTLAPMRAGVTTITPGGGVKTSVTPGPILQAMSPPPMQDLLMEGSGVSGNPGSSSGGVGVSTAAAAAAGGVGGVGVSAPLPAGVPGVTSPAMDLLVVPPGGNVLGLPVISSPGVPMLGTDGTVKLEHGDAAAAAVSTPHAAAGGAAAAAGGVPHVVDVAPKVESPDSDSSQGGNQQDLQYPMDLLNSLQSMGSADLMLADDLSRDDLWESLFGGNSGSHSPLGSLDAMVGLMGPGAEHFQHHQHHQQQQQHGLYEQQVQVPQQQQQQGHLPGVVSGATPAAAAGGGASG